MRARTPLVTVILPVRNGASTLPLALSSILGQSLVDWECIVIDDGSSDRSVSVARSYDDPRIKVITDGQTRGLTTRLNEGISASRADLIARMDADDIAFPERLEQQVGYLLNNPGVDLLGTRVIVFGSSGEPLGTRCAPQTHSEICARPHVGFPISHPTWVGRRGWFDTYRYRPDAIRCEDQDLLLRSYRTSKFANLPNALLGYREESLSLGKILRSRRCMIESLFGNFGREGEWVTALRALGGQMARAATDTFAIATRLDYHILRHRALPLSSVDVEQWKGVRAHFDAAEM